MFLLNSCLGQFSAACLATRHPFSRTYGVNLPSSLTTLLPLVLGFSPHPPVSVCGTGTHALNSSFSRQCGITLFGTITYPSRLRNDRRTSLTVYLLRLVAHFLQCDFVILLCPCLSQTSIGSTEISICCPSATPVGLALGPD